MQADLRKNELVAGDVRLYSPSPALAAGAGVSGALGICVLRVILGAFPDFSFGSPSRALLVFPSMRWLSFWVWFLMRWLVLRSAGMCADAASVQTWYKFQR